jgi:hypothetical protein
MNKPAEYSSSIPLNEETSFVVAEDDNGINGGIMNKALQRKSGA